jgi:hypothetical protein
LDHRLVEVSRALFIFLDEKALLPNVRPAAAARDRGAFFEGELIAIMVVFGRRRVVERMGRGESFIRPPRSSFISRASAKLKGIHTRFVIGT